MRLKFGTLIGLMTLPLMFAACSVETMPQEAEGSVTSEELVRRKLEFTPFTDPAGVAAAGSKPQRVLITRASQYRRLFGHDAPAEVNFAKGDAVIFYSAGVKNTGGYTASIQSISVSQRGLRVTTRLESPGPDCIVTQAVTEPYTLVKFRLPRGNHRAEFVSDDIVRDCSTNPCDEFECAAGEHCELQEVVCVTTPCDPVPVCVPDEPAPPFCGGIAGIQCPGAGSCVDDPRDDCDPANGGADCGGLCECRAIGLCVEGYVWDSSADVCGCVEQQVTDPCATVRCRAGFHCEVVDGSAVCTADPPGCEVTLCREGTRCEELPSGEPVCVSDGTLQCGDVTCSAGTTCCNASCGMCVPPGMACIQIACN